MTEPQRYDNGGTLRPGITLAVNTSGEPEPVIVPDPLDGGES